MKEFRQDCLDKVKPDYSSIARKEKTYRRLDMIPNEYRNSKLLIIGDAQHIESNYLKEKGFTNIFSAECDYPDENQIKFNLEKEKLNEKFDFIFCSHVLEHVDNIYGALRNLREMMSDKAMLFVPEENICWYEPYHRCCFTLHGWKEIFTRGRLKVLEAKEFANNDRYEYKFFLSIDYP